MTVLTDIHWTIQNWSETDKFIHWIYSTIKKVTHASLLSSSFYIVRPFNVLVSCPPVIHSLSCGSCPLPFQIFFFYILFFNLYFRYFLSQSYTTYDSSVFAFLGLRNCAAQVRTFPRYQAWVIEMKTPWWFKPILFT